MSKVTTKVRAVIGALGILAFASPVAAQTHHRGAQMRYAATWVQRSGAAWRGARPIRAMRWRAGWGWGYRAGGPRWGYGAVVVGPRWGYRGGYRVWDPPFPPRVWPRPWGPPPFRAIRRPWGRPWISARYRVG